MGGWGTHVGGGVERGILECETECGEEILVETSSERQDRC